MLKTIPGLTSANDPNFAHEVPAEEERRTPSSEKSLPKVLVVDDEQLIADTITEILKRHGFNVVCAYSGDHALKIFRGFGPDYLLADVLMPFMNGVELAIRIRKASASTRILLFSGHANCAELLNEARLQGYQFEVVSKPIHPEKLMQLLREQR